MATTKKPTPPAPPAPPAPKGTKRRYSDEERANALAALTANGGNVSRTAQQLGIPEVTLRQWHTGIRHPEAMQMSETKKESMADALEAVAWKLLEAIPDKIKKAPLNHIATTMGISIDKARLLRGESTSVLETRDDSRMQELRKRYAEVRGARGAGAGESGEAGEVSSHGDDASVQPPGASSDRTSEHGGGGEGAGVVADGGTGGGGNPIAGKLSAA